MNENIEESKNSEESSRIYTLYYSFFLIPFMIAIFGAVFFLLFRFITFETNDASELLNQIKIGSASKTSNLFFLVPPTTAVIEIKTNLDPHELLDELQGLEKQHNRKRTKRWGPRSIDLDLSLIHI